jgi:mono/diheme cytochrome c family protein
MMRFLKILLAVVVCLVVLVAVAITFTIGWRPFIGPRARPLTSRVFDRTPQRWARGQYIVEHLAACADCHSPHDWTKHDAPILPGMEAAGQNMALKGLPGFVVAPNLTPDPETGSGTWSDDALARAIREGVGHDGRALFNIMPYENYRRMPDEDLASVVVFLRSLPPVRNPLPKTVLIFPVNYLMRSVPQPVTDPVAATASTDPVVRGEFLVTMAGCKDCHTPMNDKGEFLPNMELSGGQIFEGPWGRVASPNLTPDPSGIPYYDEVLFMQALRTGYVRARPLNQIMPWRHYGGMTDDDLKAIFAYLKSVKPIHHVVDNAEPPTMCVICKAAHGGGEKNK